MLTIIGAGERGVRFRLGRLLDVVGPGVVLSLPYIDRIQKVDVRWHLMELAGERVLTRDSALVFVDVAVHYKIDKPERVVMEVKNLEETLRACAQAELRGLLGELSLSEVLWRREFVNARLRENLNQAAERFGVLASDVELKEVAPSAAVYEAMSQKKAALLAAEAEKEAGLIRARGKAEAAEIMVNKPSGQKNRAAKGRGRNGKKRAGA